MSPPSTEREWRCFHCDEVFKTKKAAALHFGCEVTDQAACKQLNDDQNALLHVIRDQSLQLFRMREEITPLDQLRHIIDHHIYQEVRNAEELGYRRGLEDGRRDWLKILWWRLEVKFPILSHLKPKRS